MWRVSNIFTFTYRIVSCALDVRTLQTTAVHAGRPTCDYRQRDTDGVA